MTKVKKITLITIAILVLTACNQTVPVQTNGEELENVQEEIITEITPEKVTEGEDGFVRMPGEPSREDKSYYITEDICGQFTAQLISKKLGQDIIKTEPSDILGVYSCKYYVTDSAYIWLNLEYMNAENQKKGHEVLERSVEESSVIPMSNYVVYQEDGELNEIYLVLTDNKFLSLNRSSGQAAGKQEFMDFAVGIAQTIKDFK